MEKFSNYISLTKQFIRNCTKFPQFDNIHIVLGNESCDLDSMIAALLLSYFYSTKNDRYTTLSLPIMNITRDHFPIRTDNAFVIEKAGINSDHLTFKNEVNFQYLMNQFKVTISLVDHHILAKKDEYLMSHVTEIFDHRPLDTDHKWDLNKVKMIKEDVGSCCTLIANKIFNSGCGEQILETKKLAYLAYQAIIFDTVALKKSPDGRATLLDLEIGEKLEKICDIEPTSRQNIFDELWTVHNDVSRLNPSQLLFKDLKVYESIYMPGLPMLAENYLNMPDALSAVERFADEYKVKVVLLVGLEHNQSKIKRDLAVYSRDPDCKVRECLMTVLNSNNSGYNFQFEKRQHASAKIDLLHVHNIRLSRKALVVLVKIAWKNYCKLL